MVMLGLLLGLNLGWEVSTPKILIDGSYLEDQRGWPYRTYTIRDVLDPSATLDTGHYIIQPGVNGTIGGRFVMRNETSRTRVYSEGIVANILFDLCVLGSTALLLEWRIRRKTFQPEPVPQ